MDAQHESYRQYMKGQFQEWESRIADLNSVVHMLEGDARREYEHHLRQLQSYHRSVFHKYWDLLLAGEDQWDEMQAELDAATDQLNAMLTEFILQPA